MLLAVFLKLFVHSHQSALGLFAASHFIAFLHTRTQDVPPSGANITAVCVYLWVSQSLLRLFLIFPLLTMGPISFNKIFIIFMCFSQSWICLGCIKFSHPQLLSLSWSWQKVPILMEDLSAQKAIPSCPLLSREQGALETHVPPPSSK